MEVIAIPLPLGTWYPGGTSSKQAEIAASSISPRPTRNETFTQDVANFEHLNPKHKLVRKDRRNLFISQKYMNKTQFFLFIIQKNQLKTFCILFNLTLESFVRSRWPEQVETLGGFMQPSS